MEASEFCKSLNAELAGWREKMFGILSHVETLPALDRQYFAPDLHVIRSVIAEIEDSMKEIRFDCPVDAGMRA